MERLFENLGSVKWLKLPRILPLDSTRRAYNTPYEPPAARANMLMLVGLWPTAIKLNP